MPTALPSLTAACISWCIPLAKTKLPLVELVLFGILGALTFGLKFVMSWLPNIEPVSLLVMLFAVTFGKKSIYPIYVYVAMEILIYGINDWNVCYLYVWTVLALVAWLLRDMKNPLGWALVSAVFGLLFGALCAPVKLAMGGPGYALSWWISGIPFDILHCGGNFAMALLFIPLRKLLDKLYTTIKTKAGAR